MKQPPFHGRAHHPLSDWKTNHRPALPSVKVDSSFYGGGAVSILLAARRAPPPSGLVLHHRSLEAFHPMLFPVRPSARKPG